MNATTTARRITRAPELLRGYPPGTAEAAAEYLHDGSSAALDRFIAGVLTHHLAPKPGRPPIAELDASALLVADLGLDSLAMVEMTFLLDELLGAKFTDDELRALTTLGDLRTAVHAKRINL